jgi:hypothetical protein
LFVIDKMFGADQEALAVVGATEGLRQVNSERISGRSMAQHSIMSVLIRSMGH